MEKDWMLQTIQLAPHKCMYTVCVSLKNILTHHMHVYRFDTLMMQCWDSDPDKETNILSATDQHQCAMLTVTDGYLDLSTCIIQSAEHEKVYTALFT